MLHQIKFDFIFLIIGVISGNAMKPITVAQQNVKNSSTLAHDMPSPVREEQQLFEGLLANNRGAAKKMPEEREVTDERRSATSFFSPLEQGLLLKTQKSGEHFFADKLYSPDSDKVTLPPDMERFDTGVSSPVSAEIKVPAGKEFVPEPKSAQKEESSVLRKDIQGTLPLNADHNASRDKPFTASLFVNRAHNIAGDVQSFRGVSNAQEQLDKHLPASSISSSGLSGIARPEDKKVIAREPLIPEVKAVFEENKLARDIQGRQEGEQSANSLLARGISPFALSDIAQSVDRKVIADQHHVPEQKAELEEKKPVPGEDILAVPTAGIPVNEKINESSAVSGSVAGVEYRNINNTYSSRRPLAEQFIISSGKRYADNGLPVAANIAGLSLEKAMPGEALLFEQKVTRQEELLFSGGSAQVASLATTSINQTGSSDVLAVIKPQNIAFDEVHSFEDVLTGQVMAPMKKAIVSISPSPVNMSVKAQLLPEDSESALSILSLNSSVAPDIQYISELRADKNMRPAFDGTMANPPTPLKDTDFPASVIQKHAFAEEAKSAFGSFDLLKASMPDEGVPIPGREVEKVIADKLWQREEPLRSTDDLAPGFPVMSSKSHLLGDSILQSINSQGNDTRHLQEVLLRTVETALTTLSSGEKSIHLQLKEQLLPGTSITVERSNGILSIVIRTNQEQSFALLEAHKEQLMKQLEQRYDHETVQLEFFNDSESEDERSRQQRDLYEEWLEELSR
ncbi:hypothetical protein SG34_032485 [Thalassomonas viridans]|uniref:Uncharacterized protein n=1 Tax=Thalassomonas viridans TaxID=137584 RepID=A0AAF0CAK1_9GAMM|nr:type III secretion HpaP family protein [Thalassomonas viridans]WDE08637.1 hypothetical protein SG34_032485 [Thalassomonas viridans]